VAAERRSKHEVTSLTPSELFEVLDMETIEAAAWRYIQWVLLVIVDGEVHGLMMLRKF
jgi:hypothetical protein